MAYEKQFWEETPVDNSESDRLYYENIRLEKKITELKQVLKELYMHEYGGNSVSFNDSCARSDKNDLYEQKIIKAIIS